MAENLLRKGFQVSLYDVKYGPNTEALDCEKIVGDVTDRNLIHDAIRGKDVVIHLAAVSRVETGQRLPEDCLRVNVLGTLNILEAIAKSETPVLIYGSSREVYGNPRSLPVREGDAKRPLSVYGVSKLTAESLIRAFHRTEDVPYLIFRFSNVYGSTHDLPERVIPKFTRLALAGEALPVNWGKQVLDFTFIDDVVDGLAKSLEKISADEDIANTDINLATRSGTSVLQLAKKIKTIFHSGSEISILPRRSYDVTKFIGNFNKARRYLGWRPSFSLADGLKAYKKRLEG